MTNKSAFELDSLGRKFRDNDNPILICTYQEQGDGDYCEQPATRNLYTKRGKYNGVSRCKEHKNV